MSTIPHSKEKCEVRNNRGSASSVTTTTAPGPDDAVLEFVESGSSADSMTTSCNSKRGRSRQESERGPKRRHKSEPKTELSYNRAMDQRGEDIRLKLTSCNYEMKYLEYALSEFPDLEVLEKLFQAVEEVQKAMRDANEWIQRRLSNIDFEVLGYEVRDEWEALLETSNDLVNNGETLKAMLLEVKSHLET